MTENALKFETFLFDALPLAPDLPPLLLSGPPGAGKTYTSSHAIVALLKGAKRVGIASNSHKAINNLLKDVEGVALEQGVRFTGIKKSSNEEQFFDGKTIANTLDNPIWRSPDCIAFDATFGKPVTVMSC